MKDSRVLGLEAAADPVEVGGRPGPGVGRLGAAAELLERARERGDGAATSTGRPSYFSARLMASRAERRASCARPCVGLGRGQRRERFGLDRPQPQLFGLSAGAGRERRGLGRVALRQAQAGERDARLGGQREVPAGRGLRRLACSSTCGRLLGLAAQLEQLRLRRGGLDLDAARVRVAGELRRVRDAAPPPRPPGRARPRAGRAAPSPRRCRARP